MHRVATPAEVDHLAGQIRQFMATPGVTYDDLAAHLLESTLKQAPLLARMVEHYGTAEGPESLTGSVEVRVTLPAGVVAGHERGCQFTLASDHDAARLRWRVEEVGLVPTLHELVADTCGLLVDQVRDSGHQGVRERGRGGL